MKNTIGDLHVELINSRKNEVNTKILAALDNIFTKDKGPLDSLTNMFDKTRICNETEFDRNDYMNQKYHSFNFNNNNSGSLENCKNLLKTENLQRMIPNPIMTGNTKTRKMFKCFLESDNCVSLKESSSIGINSSKSFCPDFTRNLRQSKPIECISSDCAQTLMKLNLPDFVKSSSNQTPSLTIAELDKNNLKFLTRVNKKNKYGAEQFISYKFELKPSRN